VTFLWPILLWGLLIVPVILGLYLWVRRRALRQPVRYPTTPLAATAMLQARRARRYVPIALLAAALGVVVLAAARPVAVIPLPADQSAIVLSIDSSGSMRSQDVLPTRLDAAKAAAKTFVRALPSRVRVGLVMFGGYALLIAPPGTDRAPVLEGIDGLGFVRRTAIGEGLLEAVAALPGRVKPGFDGSLPPLPDNLPAGIVILLSDGRSNAGIDPLQAAQIARRQRVTVYTIGLGQPYAPDNMWTIGGPLDEETLKEIARLTGGTYHHASSAEGLRDVYRTLARVVGWERQREEVGALGAVVAAAVLLAALIWSQLVTHPLGA